jgi:hypothetical protein
LAANGYREARSSNNTHKRELVMAHPKKKHSKKASMEKEMKSHVKHEKKGLHEDEKMLSKMKKGCK